MGGEHTVPHRVIRMVVSVEDKTHGFGGDGSYVRKDVLSRPRKISVNNQYIVAKYNEAHIRLFMLAEVTRPVVNILSKLVHATLRVTRFTCP